MTDQSRPDDGGLDILDFVEPVDSASAFASRFREIAAAVLVQIAMDETAPPYARIQAAKSILGYSDGTPERSRPLAVTDLRELSYNDRLRVLIELLNDRELAHLVPRAIAQAAAATQTSAPAAIAAPAKMVRRAWPAHAPAASADIAGATATAAVIDTTAADAIDATAAEPVHDRTQASRTREAPDAFDVASAPTARPARQERTATPAADQDEQPPRRTAFNLKYGLAEHLPGGVFGGLRRY